MQACLCGFQGVRLISQIEENLDYMNFLLQLEDNSNGFIILAIPKN
jgi:hypothetical protein